MSYGNKISLVFVTFIFGASKVEVRAYNQLSKKLDPKTISEYFISYCVGLRGFRFYCPSHTTRVIESDRAIYFEDDTGTS